MAHTHNKNRVLSEMCSAHSTVVLCSEICGSLAGLTLVHTYSRVYSKLTSTNSTHTLLVEITQHCTNDSHTKVSWTDHVLLNFDLDYSVSIG